jgi:hypothetical protein
MKKVLSAIFLVSFLVMMVAPLMTNAIDLTAQNSCKMKRDVTVGGNVGQSPDGTNGNGTCQNNAVYTIDGNSGICCVLNTMYNITDWIFVILVGIAGLFIVIGAMNLVIAAGAPDKIKSGRDYIMFAAIGLFVAFIARAVPGLVIMAVK